MEQKILELEEIFKMILNAPKIPKSNINVIPEPKIGHTQIKDEGSNLIIQENLEYLKIIQTLKEKVSYLEGVVDNQNDQLAFANNENYKFKKTIKILKDNLLKLKGSIRVICRIRPTKKHCNFKFDDRNIHIEDKSYQLDQVHDPNVTQQEVYDEIKNEIEAVMEGYKICIFAYGQTGSGKTFTMTGNDKNEGLIFKALNDFKSISESLKTQGLSVSFDVKYLEVYNETIKDLFTGNIVTISHDNSGISLRNCSILQNLKIEEIHSQIKAASKMRKSGETSCNENSSRSHSLFIISVTIESANEKRHGSLCLIDLAGSERLSESKAENERLKETQFINKSLSALGNVIVALKRKEQHIPFRDSKLTHLMQEYFTGKSRTSMIVHINPESLNESVCSLRFATKVSECTIKPASRDVMKYL